MHKSTLMTYQEHVPQYISYVISECAQNEPVDISLIRERKAASVLPCIHSLRMHKVTPSDVLRKH